MENPGILSLRKSGNPEIGLYGAISNFGSMNYEGVKTSEKQMSWWIDFNYGCRIF